MLKSLNIPYSFHFSIDCEHYPGLQNLGLEVACTFHLNGQSKRLLFTLDMVCRHNKVSFFSCDQAAVRMILSICLSVTPVSQCSCHRIITKFSWVIGKTPVRIILWCPITKMLLKACFLIQPLEHEGRCQKCCISLCSKVFINHQYQMKASPECLNILTYWSKYWVDRLRTTLRRKV